MIPTFVRGRLTDCLLPDGLAMAASRVECAPVRSSRDLEGAARVLSGEVKPVSAGQ